MSSTTLLPSEKQKSINDPVCIPDFYVNPKTCIFVDGDYWHANPKPYLIPSRSSKVTSGHKPNEIIFRNITAADMWARDKKISQRLKKNGYRVIRFWHSELENYQEKCIQKIYSSLSF